MQPKIDSQLLQAASEGDTEALEQLMLRYQPSMLRFARRYCATPQDVEDAVQETLWIVYQRIDALRTAAAFVSWIFTIVRNQCYRLLKGTRFVDDGEQLAESFCEVREFDADLSHDLALALAQLPPHYRQVLILRDIEGRTAPETAEALGVTIETVKSRLHRARGLLREMLIETQSVP